jgi:hypothetical protein
VQHMLPRLGQRQVVIDRRGRPAGGSSNHQEECEERKLASDHDRPETSCLRRRGSFS